jgi:hypothetical protein
MGIWLCLVNEELHCAVSRNNTVSNPVYLITEALGCALLFPVRIALHIIPSTVSWDTATLSTVVNNTIVPLANCFRLTADSLVYDSHTYDSSMSVSDDQCIPCAENVFSCPGQVPPCVPTDLQRLPLTLICIL